MGSESTLPSFLLFLFVFYVFYFLCSFFFFFFLTKKLRRIPNNIRLLFSTGGKGIFWAATYLLLFFS